MMNRYSSFILGLALFIAPAVCAAESTTVWDLQNQAKLEGWNKVNLTSVNLIPSGLSISTETDGQIVRVSSLRHRVDSVSITYTSPAGGGGIFMWRAPGMKEDEAYHVPIEFVGGGQQKLVMDMTRLPQWDEKSDRIGFVINAGTTVLLQRIEFTGPSNLDLISYPLKTFFAFDRARAYSINFLWGPLMTYTEEQFNALFSEFPPSADSWNAVLYWILGIALAFTLWRKRKTGRKAIVVFFLLLSAIWVIYDARMGAEIISYAKTDWKTWWSKPYELKDYRDRGSFAAFADLATQYTEGKDSYVFVASHGWPFWGTLLYKTYPALPIHLDNVTGEEETWIIYNRRDISVNEQNQLTLNGEPLTGPGNVMLNFEPGSFIFLTE